MSVVRMVRRLAPIFPLLALSLAARGATLPTGFAETRVATGLASPTAMAFAPDGRLFVAQQGGALRVIKNGALLAQPFLTRQREFLRRTRPARRRVRPEFRVQQLRVRLLHDVDQPRSTTALSRFTASAANPDVVAAGSEVQLLNLPNLSSATNHNGGAIHFGTDGKLYIAVGDNANSANAQSLHDARWARCCASMPMARFPRTIPSSARPPASTRRSGRAACAIPFNFAIDRTNGRIHVNDVGQDTWEEVNHGDRGRQLRLAADRGPQSGRRRGRALSDPYLSERRLVLRHHRRGVLSARRPRHFPAEYAGRYFFGDFCGGFIRMLSPPNYTTSTGFATGISSLVDIQVHPDGSLYYLARGGGEVFRVQFTREHGAQHFVAAGERHGGGRPVRQLHRDRLGHGAAAVPVAAQRREHRGRHFVDVHADDRAPPTTARRSAPSSATPPARRPATRRR